MWQEGHKRRTLLETSHALHIAGATASHPLSALQPPGAGTLSDPVSAALPGRHRGSPSGRGCDQADD